MTEQLIAHGGKVWVPPQKTSPQGSAWSILFAVGLLSTLVGLFFLFKNSNFIEISNVNDFDSFTYTHFNIMYPYPVTVPLLIFGFLCNSFYLAKTSYPSKPFPPLPQVFVITLLVAIAYMLVCAFTVIPRAFISNELNSKFTSWVAEQNYKTISITEGNIFPEVTYLSELGNGYKEVLQKDNKLVYVQWEKIEKNGSTTIKIKEIGNVYPKEQETEKND